MSETVLDRQDEIDMLKGRMERLSREIGKVQDAMRLRVEAVRRVTDWHPQAMFSERLQAHSAIVQLHTEGLALCEMLGQYEQAWHRYTDLCGSDREVA